MCQVFLAHPVYTYDTKKYTYINNLAVTNQTRNVSKATAFRNLYFKVFILTKKTRNFLKFSSRVVLHSYRFCFQIQLSVIKLQSYDPNRSL